MPLTRWLWPAATIPVVAVLAWNRGTDSRAPSSPVETRVRVQASAEQPLSEESVDGIRRNVPGCKNHPSCNLVTWNYLKTKTMRPGGHKFRILPGPHVPPQVFGASSTPRPYMLYVPSGYRPENPITLWVHAPGSAVKMETVFLHNRQFAENHTIAMVFLSGLNYKMNVITKALSHLGPYPDDVAYTQVVLREVFKKINVDGRRVHCVGFSRGARFCSRLASQMSCFITSVAGVAGLRYPNPNNATQPIPVIAFHGIHDPVNPYVGGGPSYWGESIPDTIDKWAAFNGCSGQTVDTDSYRGVEIRKHAPCRNNATVILYKLLYNGHEWPENLPINVRGTIRDFFSRHSEAVQCHTVHAEDEMYHECYQHMLWVRRVGFKQQSFLYDGLSRNSTLQDIQEVLHMRVYANCPFPCRNRSGRIDNFVGLAAERRGTEELENHTWYDKARELLGSASGFSLPTDRQPSRAAGLPAICILVVVVSVVFLAASLSAIAAVQMRQRRADFHGAEARSPIVAAYAKPAETPVTTFTPRADVLRDEVMPRYADAM